MPARMIPQMWAAMRTLAYILQLVGLIGLIGTGFLVLMSVTDTILEATEGNEDPIRSREEDSSLQQRFR